jgi:prevent-host-death family protein
LVKLVKMARTVNIYEAKTSLSRLVDQAAKGEEIVIAKAGRPRARLVPMGRRAKPRKPGAWKGRVVIVSVSAPGKRQKSISHEETLESRHGGGVEGSDVGGDRGGGGC